MAADGPLERLAAQHCLADVPLSAFRTDVLELEGDAVTALIDAQFDAVAFAPVAALTVGSLRDWLLDPGTSTDDLTALRWGLTPAGPYLDPQPAQPPHR